MSTTPTKLGRAMPGWKAPAHVHAFCTTRNGGASAAPYDSLNLGLHVGDRERDVRENRRRLAAAARLPSYPVWLTQVHGIDVVPVSDPDMPQPQADGATTTVPGTVLAVLTADCLPVVLTNGGGTRVAVVHAGWRGLVAGVLGAAVAHFGPADALHAWLGPAIGPTAFEVGQEVRDAYLRRDVRHSIAFEPAGARGKYLADLYALARGELEVVSGRRSIEIGGGARCTASEPEAFFSYRRDGERSGRMATLAWIEESPETDREVSGGPGRDREEPAREWRVATKPS